MHVNPHGLLPSAQTSAHEAAGLTPQSSPVLHDLPTIELCTEEPVLPPAQPMKLKLQSSMIFRIGVLPSRRVVARRIAVFTHHATRWGRKTQSVAVTRNLSSRPIGFLVSEI
jgi:hypothetical protein